MAGVTAERGGTRGGSARRLALWGAFTGAVLLVPAVAMRFTEEVDWTTFDFVFAGVMLGGVGLVWELVAGRSGQAAHRAAFAVALAGALLLVWITGAVGIVGSEDNEANLMFGGVLAVALLGAVFAGFRPGGMVWAMVATALAQAVAGAVALAAGLGVEGEAWPMDVIGATGGFVGLWLLAAGLFRMAARQRTGA